MQFGLTHEQVNQVREIVSSISGVVKKKKEKGSLSSLFGQSVEQWTCFRGMGRFIVNYDCTKKPVFV